MSIQREPEIFYLDSKNQQIEGVPFKRRALTYIIDQFICSFTANGVIWLTGKIVVFFLIPLHRFFGIKVLSINYNSACLDFAFGFAYILAYFSLFEWLFGRTIGKLLFAMQVVNEQGGSLTFSQSFGRGISRLVDGILFGIVAYTNMKPPSYQRFGDKQAQTIVTYVDCPEISFHPTGWYFLLAACLFLVVGGVISLLSILLHLRIA